LNLTRTALATRAQVIRAANFQTNDEAGGEDVIDDAIKEAEMEVLGDYGDPIRNATFFIMNSQLKYEFRPDKSQVYRVDLLFIRDDDNDRIDYTADTTASESSKTYVQDLEFNTVTFAQDTVNAMDGNRVQVQYVPYAMHTLVRLKAAIYLLDRSNITNAESNTPTLQSRLQSQIDKIEVAIQEWKIVGSEDEKNYDPTYGENIPQRRFITY